VRESEIEPGVVVLQFGSLPTEPPHPPAEPQHPINPRIVLPGSEVRAISHIKDTQLRNIAEPFPLNSG
jgi:hypothetical protein